MNLKKIIDKLIKDKKGKVVLTQFPNTIFIIFLISYVLEYLVRSGIYNNLFRLIAFGTLFTWSWLEITDGVNYFRRIFGLTVVILILFSAAKSIKYLN
jgi:hypothetical protein